MDRKEFETLLDRYLNGTLSAVEKERMDRWLHAIKNEEDEDSIRWSAEQKQLLLHTLHEKMNVPATPVRTLTFSRWLQIAATVLLLALAGHYTWQKAITPDTLYASADTGNRKVILSDKTIVWLKNNSTLTYPEKFMGNKRLVSLEGEALFEVTADADHPFIIQCGELTAKVLGTSFNIRTAGQKIEVTVLTGKVNVSSAQDKQGIDVLPNEKALYDKVQQNITREIPANNELAEVVNSTEYTMQFDRTSVPEIMRRIEAKFNVTVTLDSDTLNGCTVTADLTGKPLETTLNGLATLFNFEYTIQNNRVTIRGGSCR